MTRTEQGAAARFVRGSRTWLVLGALFLGLVGGALAQGAAEAARAPAEQVASVVGGMWLDALKMTVIPLVVALLITGIARGAEAARAGRLAGRSILWFAAIYSASAVTGVLMMPLLINLFPLPAGAADALRSGLAGIDRSAVAASVPQAQDFFRSLLPDNAFAAAAEGQVLQLVMFTLIFAMAVTRIDEQRRQSLVRLFQAVADAFLVVIGWVLWLAPIGVFALAFTVGIGAGAAVFAALLHYILLVSVLGVVVMLGGYVIAVAAGRVSLGSFAKAMIPAQAVAISTQSSLASLPAMLASARVLNVRERIADVTLPLAVALLRGTGPAMNIGVAYYVGHWLGLEPSFAQLAAATAVAALVSTGAPSLPGQISFLTSIAPIAIAMGVPIAPLALLVAVENIPDIVRTMGNVTLDVAVTTAVDRSTGDADES